MSRSAVTPRATPATEADLLALPEGGRGYELIDGELVEKNPLRAGAEEVGFTPWHNLAQARTVVFTDPFGRRASGSGRPGGWWILPEQHTRVGDDIVRPDVAGWRRERLPELPKGVAVLSLRPDWICEVVSPGHAADDLVRKRRLYHRAEVPHYWIIDPRDETLLVLRFTPHGYIEVLAASRGEVVRAEPFAELELSVGSLFGYDDE